VGRTPCPLVLGPPGVFYEVLAVPVEIEPLQGIPSRVQGQPDGQAGLAGLFRRGGLDIRLTSYSESPEWEPGQPVVKVRLFGSYPRPGNNLT
jgi:hypothetical protein